MKGSKKKGNSLSAEKVWVSVRVTQAEKLRLKNQADIAGLSVSEFLRRNFFGGKPLVAHTDMILLAELRRVGGLLKYNFNAVRECSVTHCILGKMNENFCELRKLLEKISSSFHDS